MMPASCARRCRPRSPRRCAFARRRGRRAPGTGPRAATDRARCLVAAARSHERARSTRGSAPRSRDRAPRAVRLLAAGSPGGSARHHERASAWCGSRDRASRSRSASTSSRSSRSTNERSAGRRCATAEIHARRPTRAPARRARSARPRAGARARAAPRSFGARRAAARVVSVALGLRDGRDHALVALPRRLAPREDAVLVEHHHASARRPAASALPKARRPFAPARSPASRRGRTARGRQISRDDLARSRADRPTASTASAWV